MSNTTKPTIKQADRGRDDVITALRQLMPMRPLTYWEHLIIAERQANELHRCLGQAGPAADLKWVAELAKVTVVLVPRWRSSGSSGITTFENGRWAIGVSKHESHTRRRFTLAHELKHYLDGPRDSVTYRGIVAPQPELIANYFAACYLMPKAWVRHCWTHGLQDIEALAGLFVVSEKAMKRRLTYLGFLESEPDRSVASYFRRSVVPADLLIETAA